MTWGECRVRRYVSFRRCASALAVGVALFTVACVSVTPTRRLPEGGTPIWRLPDGATVTGGVRIDNALGNWTDAQSLAEYGEGCLSGKILVEHTYQLPRDEKQDSKWLVERIGQYMPNEEVPSNDVAILLGMAGDGYYRLSVSSNMDEISLWRKGFGCLAVRPFPITFGEAHAFAVHFRDNRIRVLLDGAVVMDCEGRFPTSVKGRMGLSAKLAQVQFTDLAYSPTGKFPAKTRGEAQAIRLRKWVGGDWVFWGDQPVARLNREYLLLTNIRTYPFGPPVCYFPLHWLQYMGQEYYANQNRRIEVEEDGAGLTIRVHGTTPKEEILSEARVGVSLDPATDAFVFDVQSEFQVQAGKTWPALNGLEFVNLVPYGSMVPQVVEGKTVATPRQQWLVWRDGDGGWYNEPINHNGWFPMKEARYPVLAGQDPWVGYFNGKERATVVQIRKGSEPVTFQLCDALFDLHLYYNRPEASLTAGSRRDIHFVLTALPLGQSRKLLAKSTLPPNAMRQKWAYPFYEIGRMDFHRGAEIAEPSLFRLWCKGSSNVAWYFPPTYWDRATGHGNAGSLRADGPLPLTVDFGPPASGESFQESKLYEISAWVKTQDVRGAGPYLAARDNTGTRPIVAGVRSGLTGTHGWTRISCVTDRFHESPSEELVAAVDGIGTAWFDDIEIRPVPDDTPITPWNPPAPPDSDLVASYRFDEKGGVGVYDYSPWGHHGEALGGKRVMDPQVGPCLEFSGRDMLYVSSDEVLQFPKGMTFSAWVYPDFTDRANRLILRKYNELSIRAGSKGPSAPKTVSLYINGLEEIVTPVPLPDRTWVHLAVTYDNDSFRVYLNGKIAYTARRAVERIRPSDFPLCLGGFWHEGHVQDDCWKGRMAGVRFYRRALSEEEVAQEPGLCLAAPGAGAGSR